MEVIINQYYSFAFNLGASFDIRVSKKPKYKYYPNFSDSFLRIRYNFCLLVFLNKNNISGQMHALTIGIGLFAKDLKREY